MGLKLMGKSERIGAPISQVLDYPDTHIKGGLLGLEGEDGHFLELIQYINPPSAERPTEERAVLGASHLAFNVTDMQATFAKLLEAGAKELNPPIETVPGRIVCYLQDPDGNWIELLDVAE
jgi:catechol 2,3-dioxygenase-like lactoylglutathione lyase family enzyme